MVALYVEPPATLIDYTTLGSRNLRRKKNKYKQNDINHSGRSETYYLIYLFSNLVAHFKHICQNKDIPVQN